MTATSRASSGADAPGRELSPSRIVFAKPTTGSAPGAVSSASTSSSRSVSPRRTRSPASGRRSTRTPPASGPYDRKLDLGAGVDAARSPGGRSARAPARASRASSSAAAHPREREVRADVGWETTRVPYPDRGARRAAGALGKRPVAGDHLARLHAATSRSSGTSRLPSPNTASTWMRRREQGGNARKELVGLEEPVDARPSVLVGGCRAAARSRTVSDASATASGWLSAYAVGQPPSGELRGGEDEQALVAPSASAASHGHLTPAPLALRDRARREPGSPITSPSATITRPRGTV